MWLKNRQARHKRDAPNQQKPNQLGGTLKVRCSRLSVFPTKQTSFGGLFLARVPMDASLSPTYVRPSLKQANSSSGSLQGQAGPKAAGDNTDAEEPLPPQPPPPQQEQPLAEER